MKIELGEYRRDMEFSVVVNREDLSAIPQTEIESEVTRIFSSLDDNSSFDDQWAALVAMVTWIRSKQK